MKRLTLLLTCFILSMGLAIAQTTKVKGVVVDESNEPIAGVSVIVKENTAVGTVTNVDGQFTLDVPASAKSLIMKYLGMEDQEVAVSPDVKVIMKQSSTMLDEVVVIAYGTVKKVGYTGSGSEIKSKTLENIPVSSFEQAIQGAAPGINVTSTSGQPGATQQLTIRGIGSMNASTQPLYVIDGIPVTSGNISQSGVSGQSGSLSLSNMVNVNDIESVTVLKDASAAAMYGSRGANGVVLITTKKGQSGKVKISLKADWGGNDWAVKYRPAVNGDQMRTLFAESYGNFLFDNKYEPTMAAAMEEAWVTVDEEAPIPNGGYSDWDKAMFRNHGAIQNYEMTANGGNAKTKFYTSLGYRDETGKVDYSWLKQYTGRANVIHTEDKLSLGTNISISRIDNRANTSGTSYSNPYYRVRYDLWPTVPIYNADGTYYEGPLLKGLNNPVKDFGLTSSGNEAFQSSSSVWGEYEFIKGLRFKQTFNYEYTNVLSSTNWPSNTGDGAVHNGLTIKINATTEKLYSSSILTYERSFAEKHNVSALVGWDANKTRDIYVQAVGKGFATPDLKELDSASIPDGIGSNSLDDRLLSFLSRLNYDYDNKYYLSGTFRRDGSSRFGSNVRWGDFWSVSGAWRIKNEAFLTGAEFLDNLKLRGSYGVSGTLPDALYAHLATYSFDADYAGKPGSVPSRIANPDLSWEKCYTLDFGLEAKLFNALTFDFDIYERKTKDLILSVPVSRTTGFSSTLANEAEMSNKGVEINVGYDVFRDGEFKWNTGIALGYNKNEVTKLYGGKEITNSPYNSQILREGEAYFSHYMREFAGINKETGEELWYMNTPLEDGTVDRSTTNDPTKVTRIVAGKATPDWTGGWRNTLSWKGFELVALISFSQGAKAYDTSWMTNANGYNDFSYLPALSQYDRWQNPGDNTQVGRRVYAYKWGNYGSTKFLHDNDYIRLKNVALTYTFPSKWIQKAGLGNLRVFAAGTNLLTMTDLKAFDPEVPIYGQIGFEAPPLKSVTFGIEVGF